jgi:ABC-type bacteriocin/lantibiotic exporter with double-glycine peptidase domain
MLVKGYLCEDAYGKMLYQQASKARFICSAFLLVALILACTITYLSLSLTWLSLCSLVLLVDLVCIKISLFKIYHGDANKAIERYEQGVDKHIEMFQKS